MSTSLIDLRIALVNAEAALRAGRDSERNQRLLVEEDAIIAAGGIKALGSNAEDRERALGLALLRDARYVATLAALRDAETGAAMAAARLEGAKDERRSAERETNERLAEALEARGLFTAVS